MPEAEANIFGRRRVLVTGAATGIGAAIVDVFVNSGADVVATFHEAPAPERSPASWLRCDVTSVNSVDETVDAAVAAMGGLDAVIHAAGLWLPGIAGTITDADIDRLVSINVRGTIHVNQAAHRIMQGSGGRIINFGSAEAVMGSPISAVYAATKGAVHAWTRSAAKAWGSEGITVNAIAPAMQTPGADRLRSFRSGRFGVHGREPEVGHPIARSPRRPGHRPCSAAGFPSRRGVWIHHRPTARRRWRPHHAGRLRNHTDRSTPWTGWASNS